MPLQFADPAVPVVITHILMRLDPSLETLRDLPAATLLRYNGTAFDYTAVLDAWCSLSERWAPVAATYAGGMLTSAMEPYLTYSGAATRFWRAPGMSAAKQRIDLTYFAIDRGTSATPPGDAHTYIETIHTRLNTCWRGNETHSWTEDPAMRTLDLTCWLIIATLDNSQTCSFNQEECDSLVDALSWLDRLLRWHLTACVPT